MMAGTNFPRWRGLTTFRVFPCVFFSCFFVVAFLREAKQKVTTKIHEKEDTKTHERLANSVATDQQCHAVRSAYRVPLSSFRLLAALCFISVSLLFTGC